MSSRKFGGTSAVAVEDIFKLETWDNITLKICRSLDSLLDALAMEAEMLNIDDYEPIEPGLSVPERTAKLLNLSKSEIDRIKQNHQIRQDVPLSDMKLQTNATYSSEAPNLKINKLLAETSLYTPTIKPVRPTKSELKSRKELTKIVQNLPEIELNSKTLQPKPEPEMNEDEEKVGEESEIELKTILHEDNTEEESNMKRRCRWAVDEMKSSTGKSFVEAGCQASTLSKRILDGFGQNVSEKSKITVDQTVDKEVVVSNCSELEEVKNEILKKRSSHFRGCKENSYLALHLHRQDLKKSMESMQNMDKFGYREDGYSRMYKEEVKPQQKKSKRHNISKQESLA